MSLENVEIDRATWKRLASPKEGCAHSGCTIPPAVSLSLTASELTGSRGGGSLARVTVGYCAPHAEQHFIAAQKALGS